MPYNGLRSPHTLDSTLTGRFFASCWFSAAWGVAVFQAVLLAQAWSHFHHALPTACIASAWIGGNVMGLRIHDALRRVTFPKAPLLWGACLCCTTGCWLLFTPWITSNAPAEQTMLSMSTLLLGSVALLMGGTSTCWLLQRRPWPLIGEGPTLARGLICLTLGLWVAWTVPAWAPLLGSLLLLPLIGTDLYPAGRSPFPARGGLVDAFVERNGGDPSCWLPLRLKRRRGTRWWWLLYLARLRYIPPTLLATCLAVGVGAVWYSVPTPFAAHLLRIHQVWALSWLVGGQLAALTLGAYIIGKSRGTIGAVDRLIPQEHQQRCWRLALLGLFLTAASLILLGMSFLQAPWSLAASLALYTLSGGTWSILFARLRPPLSTQAYALRHMLVGMGLNITSGQLSYERALEDQVTLALASWEGVLTASVAPFAGLLIDQTSFDDTLIFVGLALCLVFAAILLTLALPRRTRIASADNGLNMSR